MKTLTEDLNEIISSSPALILQYGSAACAPCMAIHQRIDLWQERHPEVVTRYIPIEDNLELAAQNGVLSAPTVTAYVDGHEVAREAGYFSLDEILGRMERYLKMMEE